MKLNVLTKIVTPVLIVLSVLFVKTNISYASTYNLIPNPSFEDGVDFPSSWSPVSGSFCNQPPTNYQSSIEWSSSRASTGSRSIGITNVYLPTQSLNTSVRIASDFIDINPTSGSYKLNSLVQGTPGNKGLRPELTVCFYDSNKNVTGSTGITTTYPPDSQAWYGITIGGLKISYFPPNTTKITIGISANCAYQFLPPGAPQDCYGSIWFDDITLEPIANLTMHKFEDLNKNGTQDSNEPNLQYWGMSTYKGVNCDSSKEIFGAWTDAIGNATLKNTPLGDYSVKETFYYVDFNPPPHLVDATKQGWYTTTPLCQNVTLDSASGATVHIGNFHGSTFPYLSQLDPQWANLEYDHASSIDPFFCGTTIGGCGCAITSSAMLLKYYGATKAPDGSETNPNTLNTWLKNNSGYAFGALKWNSIAAYSVKANEAFGTQKIRFVGPSGANDFSTLDTDLANSKPDILSEPGHFIIATKKADTSYSIADPAYESRKTLEAYGNSFTGMRRFEKTNTDLSALYITTPAPNGLFITDSLERRAGKDPQTGQILTEIPNSYYFLEPSLTDQTQQNPQTTDSGVNTLVIINPPQDSFDLQSQSGPIDVSAYDTLGNIKVKNFSTASPDSFEINYSPHPGSGFSVFQKVKIEVKPQNLNRGNGVIPVVIKSDNNFDAQDVDFDSIRFTSAQIIPVKFPLFVQNGKDNKKDLQVFFFANEIPPDSNLCLTGITTDDLNFKGCST